MDLDETGESLSSVPQQQQQQQQQDQGAQAPWSALVELFQDQREKLQAQRNKLINFTNGL